MYVLRECLGEELLPRGVRRLNCRPALKTTDIEITEHSGALPVQLRSRADPGQRALGLLVALIVGVVATATTAAPARAVIALFGGTMTQVATGVGVFQGLFHGFVGAIVWAITIGGGILVWWYGGEGPPPRSGYAAAVVGWISGLVGGVVVGAAVVLVYSEATLASTHWITTSQGHLTDAITKTRMFFIFPVYGSAIGGGVGWITARMVPWWRARAMRESDRLPRFILDTFLRAFSTSWVLLFPLAAAIFAVLTVLSEKQLEHVEMWKLIGEALTLYFGALGLITGLFAGIFILRSGITIKLEDK